MCLKNVWSDFLFFFVFTTNAISVAIDERLKKSESRCDYFIYFSVSRAHRARLILPLSLIKSRLIKKMCLYEGSLGRISWWFQILFFLFTRDSSQFVGTVCRLTRSDLCPWSFNLFLVQQSWRPWQIRENGKVELAFVVLFPVIVENIPLSAYSYLSSKKNYFFCCEMMRHDIRETDWMRWDVKCIAQKNVRREIEFSPASLYCSHSGISWTIFWTQTGCNWISVLVISTHNCLMMSQSQTDCTFSLKVELCAFVEVIFGAFPRMGKEPYTRNRKSPAITCIII